MTPSVFVQIFFLLSFAEIGKSRDLQNCATNIAVIICKESGPGSTILSNNLGERHMATVALEKKVNRQIQQTLVLLKSVAITQSTRQEPLEAYFWTQSRRDFELCANFIVVGKDPSILQEIESELSHQNWDYGMSSLIKLTFVQATYPAGLDWMEHVYRQCATLRLFLPDILPTVNQLIYVDTDIIFLRPPSLLQSTFQFFTTTQLAAITPELVTENHTLNDLYNPQHYNTGVMLMHLERMRRTKWSSKIAIVAELTLQNAFYGDQDVLIVYFKLNPEELFHLPCHWNYHPKYCKVDCGESTGISILHGLVASFFLPPGSPFEVLYRYYQEYSMNHFSLWSFNKKLGDRLWTLTKNSDESQNFCARFKNNRNGNEPTFASRVMKTLTSLEKTGLHVTTRILNNILCNTLNDTSVPSSTNSLVLKKTNYASASNCTGNIVMAVTLVESQYKVYKQPQLLTAMLKSLLVLSTSQESQLTLIIVTDKKTSCVKIESLIGAWNNGGIASICMECIVANYTQRYAWMGEIFKPGVFFRLFYPEMIGRDAVIHVDTDFIFTRHISQLWAKFKMFKPATILAAAPQLSISSDEEFPHTQFQAGIMLMNLTRMREVKWSNTLTMIAQILKPKFQSDKKLLPVQTLLHLYFKHHPEEINELYIGWNFLPHYCQEENLERFGFEFSSDASPIYAIHGVNNSFTRIDTMEPLFQELHFYYLHLNLSHPEKNRVIIPNQPSSPCSQSRRFRLGWFK